MNCPPNKILNPITNKCVLKTSIIGKKLLEKKDLKKLIISHLITIMNYEKINNNKFKVLAYSKTLNQLYNCK